MARLRSTALATRLLGEDREERGRAGSAAKVYRGESPAGVRATLVVAQRLGAEDAGATLVVAQRLGAEGVGATLVVAQRLGVEDEGATLVVAPSEGLRIDEGDTRVAPAESPYR